MEGIEDEALQLLVEAEWPGNVRELENAIESALALASGPRIRATDLPGGRRAAARSASQVPQNVPLSLASYERLALERVLTETGGDAPEAARRLGVGRSTLYRKLAKHGLQPRRS